MKQAAGFLMNTPDGNCQAVPFYYNEDDTAERKLEILELKNEQLETSLKYERVLRKQLEEQIVDLNKKIEELTANPPPRKRRTKKEMQEEVHEYSEFKSNGLPKAQAAEPIRSYRDFVDIQNYFLERKNLRDWMLWTVGVCLGLRISDLLSLKIKYFINKDLTFRKRIKIYEKKTSKLNNCLITEAVIDAIKKYFDAINWEFNLDDYLFMSRKTKSKIREEHGWKIISDAGKFLKLPYNVGSHTMRKSFANIAACVDRTSVDMNAITKIQGLLNHSDQRVTMKYLGTFQNMYDNARIAVSDFALGKTNVTELIAGQKSASDEILSKLDALETRFFDKQETYGGNDEAD